MPNLKPFREYSEHDVINLFAYSGASNSINKGTFVRLESGWVSDVEIAYGENVGATYGNTVSMRYGVRPKVTASVSGDTPLGMMLYDVRETDENGERLILNPAKQAAMGVVLSGQAVPIVTRGIFLYSGIVGDPIKGSNLYASAAGGLQTAAQASTPVVAKALGPKDVEGYTLIKINL